MTRDNDLSAANDTANAALKPQYRADYSNTMGLVVNRMAVGTLQLMDICVETATIWQVETSLSPSLACPRCRRCVSTV